MLVTGPQYQNESKLTLDNIVETTPAHNGQFYLKSHKIIFTGPTFMSF